MCPTLVIRKWGDIIQNDYASRLAISCRQAEGDLDTPVAPLHSGIGRIEEMMKTMVDNQSRIIDENVALRAQVQVLSNEVVFLRKGLQYANKRLHSIDHGNLRLSSILKSPDKVISSSSAIEPPPSFDINTDTTFSEAVNVEAAVAAEALKPSAAPASLHKQTSSQSQSSSVTLPLPPADEPLVQTQPKPIVKISGWNSHAEAKSTTKKNDANSKVSDLLLTLRENGSISARQISDATLPDWICASGNKCYYRYCLEFIQFISTTNKVIASSVAKIADNSTNDTAALTAAEIVAKACFDNIQELDGKKVRKYTTIALGTRVRDYKQQIAAARQKTNPNQKFTAENVELVSADELQQLITQGAPGTPKGNKSILSYGTARRIKDK
jgi:hypothetical protein